MQSFSSEVNGKVYSTTYLEMIGEPTILEISFSYVPQFEEAYAVSFIHHDIGWVSEVDRDSWELFRTRGEALKFYNGEVATRLEGHDRFRKVKELPKNSEVIPIKRKKGKAEKTVPKNTRFREWNDDLDKLTAKK